MDFEFDNEMDAILKRTRAGDGATFETHPDADEIAAFTERALSDASRQRLTAHFADCGRCRTILSTTFVFEPEEATVAAAAVSTETAPLPWYRKLFVFPQLAYTMGALALLFSGFFGYVVLKNVGGTNDVAMAPKAKSSAPTQTADTKPANAPASTNTTTNAPTNAAPAANMPVAAATTRPTPVEVDGAEDVETRGPSATPPVTVAVRPKDDATRDKVAEREPERVEPLPLPGQNQSQQVYNNTQRNDGLGSVPNNSGVQGTLSSPKTEPKVNEDRSYDQKSVDETTRGAESDMARKKAYEPSKSVNGRNFTKRAGVWYDPLYKNQTQIKVRRGSDEYKALDADVRSISEKLGGTVVIISGTKAYRIE